MESCHVPIAVILACFQASNARATVEGLGVAFRSTHLMEAHEGAHLGLTVILYDIEISLIHPLSIDVLPSFYCCYIGWFYR